MTKVTDEQIMIHLLNGKTQRQIAEEVGLSVTHVCRRINRPDFQSRMSVYRKQVVDSSLTQLTTHAQKSIQVLAELLDDKNAFVRFNSASRILSLIQDFTAQVDLMKEIQELKEQQS